MRGEHSIPAEIIDDSFELSLLELCRCCAVRAEVVIGMVDEGVIEPRGRSEADWRFDGLMLRRVEIALKLQRDLRINLAGAALALDLMDELARLREKLHRLGDDAC
ncbi:MAG: MerR family transcriptional regulator [Gammaproteobacteria bacterium]|nr:MerR family transcriptional regulator [Gammaproteobacteria bacterium]